MMERDRWEQIERLYHAALERGPGAREVFLDEACAGDEDLRREVVGLLACDVPSDSFIQSPAIEIAARAMAAEPLIEASSKPMMSLIAGSQIGAYRLLEPLGRGGMGEVHLALDTRLNRKVAIKFLPVEFTTDAGRVRRFEQEARAASALNHPNIITIHEIGETDSTHYLVTEYIEGETLRQRLTNTQQIPLKLPETIGLAAQIAAALAAAHGAGIIHRDIKPENVMVRRDGIVKVLDFGLAKLTEPSSPAVNTQAATLARNRTDSGVVVGTPRYMSPEQARGEKVDARTDIFSLGVALYELLAGRAPFNGVTANDCIAAILKDEPPELSEVNQKVTPQLEKIVRRCMEKKAEQRFQSASDLCFALEALSTSSGSRPESQLDAQSAAPAVTENVGASSVRNRERLAWLATVALLLGILGFTWTYFTRQPATDTRVFKTSIMPPERSSFDQIAVSPDGRHLAFTATTEGKLQLWVRAIDSTDARPLAGTQGAILPFWSPDSRFICFFAEDRLKKIEVTGGPVQTLRNVAGALGGAWSRDDVILYGQSEIGLLSISAKSGNVTQVTTIDKPQREAVHFYPTFLPDGRHFLYSILSEKKDSRGVYLGSLDGTVKRRLLDDVTVIKYMAAVPGETTGGAGWLVFVRDGALLARPFDTSQLKFTGEPFSLSDKVGSDSFFIPGSTFSVSDNGVLVFDPSPNRQRHQYRWVDRRGQQINSLDLPAGLYQFWLSPNEKRFIADRFDSQTATLDLWMYDVSGGNPARFTFDQAGDFNPVWSPDGSRIVWSSMRDGVMLNLYQRAASLAGEEMLLLKSDYPKMPTDWSQDGRFIIYRQYDPKTKWDVWFLPVSRSGEAKPFRVLETEANEVAATLSPDGRWLAYASNASGQYEVYVQSFPGGSGKRQVSTGGDCSHPRWRRDGRELFYYARDKKLMAARVRSGENFGVGAAVSLFEFSAGTVHHGFSPYAVTRDGQRFLINALVEMEPNAPLTVVVNWADLKK